jgi:hypothetical protein
MKIPVSDILTDQRKTGWYVIAADGSPVRLASQGGRRLHMWFTKELAEGLARQTVGWTDANRTTIKDVVISYILAPESPKAADDDPA